MKEQKEKKIIKYVDEFAELYIDAVIRYIQQEKIDISAIKFMLGKAPYRFPPKMIVQKLNKELIVHSFELSFRNEANYLLDCYASDINQYIEENPEFKQSVYDRLKMHLKKVQDLT